MMTVIGDLILFLILLYNLDINKFLSAPNSILNDLLRALKTFTYIAIIN